MPYEEETTTTDTTTTSSSSEDRSPILAVDMDETIIQSDTEELIPGAKDALLALRKMGWKIIIWTCRGNTGKPTREILDRHGIPYDAINENFSGREGKSRKILFDAVVDNKNVDFHDGWEAVVEELVKRRKGWQHQGITKATIYQINPVSGEKEAVQEWCLSTTGEAVLTKGCEEEVLEMDLNSSPKDGEVFLKEVERSINNTYLFAEVARGSEFIFAPKKRLKTKLGSKAGCYSPIFEGLPPTGE